MTNLPRPDQLDTVIYHAHCLDGFTAAWAAWRTLGSNTKYIPANYGDDPPDVEGLRIVIVDFSYRRNTLERMIQKAESLIVLDHHKTAKQELEGLENAIFDMDKSGARLAWEWFYPGVEVPDVVKYVEDRDLWKFNLKSSREINSALTLFDRTFETWNEVRSMLDTPRGRESIVKAGSTVLRHTDMLSKKIAERATVRNIGGTEMWVVNCIHELASTTGDVLRDRKTEDGQTPGVSMMWAYDGEGSVIRCSLRSRDDRADVSEIARSFGGGGHRNAAGFEWKQPLEKLLG